MDDDLLKKIQNISNQINEENHHAVLDSQETAEDYFERLDEDDTRRYEKMKEAIVQEKKAAQTYEELTKVLIQRLF
jgi:hypothetical protein